MNFLFLFKVRSTDPWYCKFYTSIQCGQELDTLCTDAKGDNSFLPVTGILQQGGPVYWRQHQMTIDAQLVEFEGAMNRWSGSSFTDVLVWRIWSFCSWSCHSSEGVSSDIGRWSYYIWHRCFWDAGLQPPGHWGFWSLLSIWHGITKYKHHICLSDLSCVVKMLWELCRHPMNAMIYLWNMMDLSRMIKEQFSVLMESGVNL